MASPTFGGTLNMTHIGTATAILEINGVNMLTDPFFSPGGTEFDVGVAVLKVDDTPAMSLKDLPIIDVILLSHEDHPDNLDELGRQLLDGRRVLTTLDGAQKLAPRPGVIGLRPWETVSVNVGGKQFQVTGTPCQHMPGGEVTGFIITEPGFGTTDGLPNAIYFSGDTVYIEELAEIRSKFHISVAILNLGAAIAALPGHEPLMITMDGKQASRLSKEIGADVIVPMHYESWNHFSQHGKELLQAFQEEGISDKISWLEPGVTKKIF
ncbi:beta-lactamase superfamily domain-containing protein [Plectosphaerella plurivora]|uniref:Beta-lactamase superfamily domain-containing protein n=1 Tax=Plectosphaerella plurivora TaxID=936078 RepID=A0A9P9A9R3_9PEZI|nr:beta-lactamase superfamily domain-containing protein [Plectosphaerella plurivora]